jgi:dTDP-4-amino-4,6-dideoxygalactose transaminase
MKKNKINIQLYDITVSSKAQKEVLATLQSGWLSNGIKTSEFEKLMCRVLDVKYATAVSSASNGLILALKANGIKRGDRVITSPFTFVATIEAIQAIGAIPVFTDIMPDCFTIDPSQIQKRITTKTKAIIPIDIAGHPADYSALKKICNENNLKLISDSAHAVSSKYKGKSIAHWCDSSVISLHVTKNLFCGEGGIVFTQKKKINDKIKLLSNHGIERKNNNSNKWEYNINDHGMKGNISEVHSAIGIGQISQFKTNQEKRKKIVKRYISNLTRYSKFINLPVTSNNSVHGWHLFIIKLKTEKLKIDRYKFINLMAESNIECGVHYKPIFELSHYKKSLKLSNSSFPIANNIWRQIVTLPLYPKLKLYQVDQICHVIGKILTKYSKK